MSKHSSREMSSGGNSGSKFASSLQTGDLPRNGEAHVPARYAPASRPTALPLSRTERADLERLAQHHPTALAKRARLLLARADGETLRAIGERFGVHPDTVRRWLVRYAQRGLAGLRHGNLGKSRNLVFDAPTRAKIRRLAETDPTVLGEHFRRWSLIKLRDHLVHHGIVRTISHESLRQILLVGPSLQRYWRASRGSASHR